MAGKLATLREDPSRLIDMTEAEGGDTPTEFKESCKIVCTESAILLHLYFTTLGPSEVN